MKSKNKGKTVILCQSCGRPVQVVKAWYKDWQLICPSCFEYLDIVELCLKTLQSEASRQGADLPMVSPTEQKKC